VTDFVADLLLIDLSHLFRVHWHASESQEVGEAFSRTVEQVNRLASKYRMVLVCCDAPPYKRKELSPDYKAQREAAPPMLGEQIRRTEERLKADGFLLGKSAGFEADDVIASAVYWATREEPPLSVVVASSDKDLLMLVSDAHNVRALHPMSGVFFDEAAVKEKMLVGPRLLTDSLALQGDSSDNIRGIKGCGPKNAAKLLERFGDLEGVLQGFRTIEQPAMRANIEAGADAARLARKLVTLDENVPIDFEAVYVKRERQPLVKEMLDVIDAEFDEVADDMGDLLSAPPQKDSVPDSGNARTDAASPGAPEARTTDETAREPDRAPPAAGSSGPSGPSVVSSPQAPASTSLALAPVEYALQLEPRNGREALGLAEKMYNSRLFSQFGTPEAVLAIILRGRSLGLDAVTALSCFHVVEQKPVMHAHLIIALCMKEPDCEYFQYLDGDDTFAEYETKHRRNPKPTRMRYTIAQAEQAGLTAKRGSNWVRIPAEMLRKMAGVQLGRVVYPSAAMGVYATEELE
jgi:5'-3' exonuclease